MEWQPHYSEPLTEEDARAIAGNAATFFAMLMDWDLGVKEARRGNGAKQREDNG